MAVDPVPYVVHGAKHSADVFRQAHYDATGGADGISLPPDLNVKATGTPSNQIRVSTGGATILNSYQGGGGQSYSFRNASETLVDVPASDSTGAKSYHIIARIEDPQFGGQAPDDPLAGPYAFLECVSQSATIVHPHYILADVVVPASTATITGAMITDRREVANPVVGQFTFSRPRIMEDDGKQIKLTNRLTVGGVGPWWGEYFPGGAGVPNETRQKIPLRATHMSIRADWMGISVKGGENSHGRYWIEFGDQNKAHGWPGGRNFEYATQQFGFDTSGAGSNYKEPWPLMDQVYIPKKLRGKEVTFIFKAGLNASASTAGVTMAALGGLGLHAVFSMSPIDSDTI